MLEDIYRDGPDTAKKSQKQGATCVTPFSIYRCRDTGLSRLGLRNEPAPQPQHTLLSSPKKRPKYCHQPHAHTHGWSHTHMHIEANINPYRLFVPHLRNSKNLPSVCPQLQTAADPQPRTEVDYRAQVITVQF